VCCAVAGFCVSAGVPRRRCRRRAYRGLFDFKPRPLVTTKLLPAVMHDERARGTAFWTAQYNETGTTTRPRVSLCDSGRACCPP